MRALLCLLALATPLLARAVEFASGEARVHVVELFTSEGCSSCPPADKWLSGLRTEKGLWTDFVPIGWHVDYWDDLGWKDRFSKPAWTARQRAFAQAWHTSTVYTPCLVRDGKEWTSAKKAPTAGPEKVGILKATYDSGRITITFQPSDNSISPGGNRNSKIENQKSYQAHAAILGGGIVSKVTRGENSGSTLRHDFVVLAEDDANMENLTADLTLGSASASPSFRRTDVPLYYLAVWITRAGSSEPIQATGGSLQL